ncbi:MAG: hypothetical protein AVO39_11100 [delta proteobacterium MLS_D]|nr:MAG: hypothetical protein AVO39_11100 [delta proteobacterium MLS_D]
MATYYTSSSATGGGDGSINDEFTLQEAADTAVAGDVVLIKADGTYSPTATIDFDTNAGSGNSQIEFKGCASDGTDDDTRATIDGASISSAPIFKTITGGLQFKNLVLQNGTSHNVDHSNGSPEIWENCRFTGATYEGFYDSHSIDHTLKFIECEVDNNGRKGYGNNATDRGGTWWIRCSIHDNVSHGIAEADRSGNRILIIDCLIYDNGGDGICDDGYRATLNVMIKGCTIFGNGGDGIDYGAGSAAYSINIESCIIRSNGGYGINTNTGNTNFALLKNCCFSNNTSGAVDINSGTPWGSDNITSDPKFVSETDGSEDFSLQSDSPCLAAGTDGGIW